MPRCYPMLMSDRRCPDRLCQRPLPADAQRHGPRRGSRLSVRRRRLRSLRGEGRAPDRRAAPPGAAAALARRIAHPRADVAAALGVVLREVVARNRVRYGIVYLQMTRGVARRDHAFPAPDVAPSLVVTARRSTGARNEALAGERHRGHQRAGQSLGPRRHQDDRAAAERAGAAGRHRRGRARRLVRR